MKSKASEDFSAIFVPTRLVQDVEIKYFITSHKTLFKGINEICQNILNCDDFLKEYGFVKIENYKKIFKLKQSENNKTYYIIKELNEKSDTIVSFYNLCLNENHYFAYSEQKYFNSQIKELKEKINYIFPKYQKFITKENTKKLVEFLPLIEPNSNERVDWLFKRKSHNIKVIRKEKEDNKRYFDTILDYPLDDQQRRAIVTLEDNTLVISSAGSGKTSTSIAKVKYLIDKVGLKKSEILALSYNKKTALEFEERLNTPGVKCSTFHALALYIIGKATGEKPTICDEYFIIQCYYKLIKQSPSYKKAINKFFGELTSLTKFQHDYDNSKDYYSDRELYGIVAPYGDMNGNIIYTKSEEEKKICTWLSTHGINFIYENPYPIRTVDSNYRQYLPDFTIYYGENNEYCIYLEHFGIDKNGNVPAWFGTGEKGGWSYVNRKYKEAIEWKRNLHEENDTVLIETTSAMFHDGSIFEKLEEMLNEYEIPLRELREDEKYNLLVERNKSMEESIKNLLFSFISLMKSNGKSFEEIHENIKNNNEDEEFIERNRFLMYEVIKPLFDFYQEELKRTEKLDFTDLILNATEICNNKEWTPPYKYIIVDEFQDISVDRYKFILALRSGKQFCKTFCVGDDWQSIYRFSGSDMNLFNQFDKYFGYTAKCKIETTYRFGNPLLKRSSKFILKNPAQTEKEVRTYSSEKETYLSFVPFSRDYSNDNYLETIEQILEEIPENESILLIARYNHEVEVFPDKWIKDSNNSKKKIITYNSREMDFMSIHAAKGTEKDNVIILNCSQDRGGFPSRISDDPILGYVLSEIDDFEYSEERRLFYVAVTRAKKHAYVLYNEKMPSVFVTEMIEDEESDKLICPRCGKGILKYNKEALSKNGSYYRNYYCSNSVAGCDYFWRVFYEDEEDIKNQHILLK